MLMSGTRIAPARFVEWILSWRFTVFVQGNGANSSEGWKLGIYAV